MTGRSSEDVGHAAAPSGGKDRPGGVGAVAAGPGIAFPQGLPGFPAATRFALLPLEGNPNGLLVLQSADDPDLRFLVLPYTEQGLPLRRADVETACAALEVPAEHAVVLLVVTRAPDEAGRRGPAQLFVNLRAPVVLDAERRTAVQHVLATSGYSIRHPLPAAA